MEKELRNVVKRLLKEAAFNAYGIRRIAEDNGLLEDIMRFDIERVVAGYNVEFNAEREMNLHYTPKDTLEFVIYNLEMDPNYYDKDLSKFSKAILAKESEGAYTYRKIGHSLFLKGGVDNIDKKKAEIVKKFIVFVSEHLVLDEPCKIHLSAKRNEHLETTASYNPNNHDIWIYVKNRNMLGDILRSLAHEMMHLKQNLRGDLKHHSGRDGSPHENEANTFSGMMIRKFGRMFPEIYE
jgi:hypothetical protein